MGSRLVLVNIGGSSVIELWLLGYWTGIFIATSNGTNSLFEATSVSANNFSFKFLGQSSSQINLIYFNAF